MAININQLIIAASEKMEFTRETYELINFKFEKEFELILEQFVIDLHNDYNLNEIKLDLIKNECVINFERLNEKWVNLNNPKNLSFVFQKLNMIKVKEKQSNSSTIDNLTICAIGFMDRGYPEEMDSISEHFDEENSDILIQLESGMAIKINSGIVFCKKDE